jgi:hypothetical protein
MHFSNTLSSITMVILFIASFYINPELFYSFNSAYVMNTELIQSQQDLIDNNKRLLEIQQLGNLPIVKLENVFLLTVICLAVYLGYSFYMTSNNDQELFISLSEAAATNAATLNEHVIVSNKNTAVTLSNSIQQLAEQNTRDHCQVSELIFEQVVKKLNQVIALLENQGANCGSTPVRPVVPTQIELSALRNATWSTFLN